MAYEYKYNAKKTAYDTQYVKEHYDRVEVRLPKGRKDIYKARAAEQGMTLTDYIVGLIEQDMKGEN